jgi:uncharacterized protein (UPF0305 family)
MDQDIKSKEVSTADIMGDYKTFMTSAESKQFTDYQHRAVYIEDFMKYINRRLVIIDNEYYNDHVYIDGNKTASIGPVRMSGYIEQLQGIKDLVDRTIDNLQSI